MMKYGVIFDCDGTLVDSLGNAYESFNYALDKIGEGPRTPEEIKRFFGTSAERILIQLLQDEKKGVKAFSIYLEHQEEIAGQTKLHAGIRDLLDLLKEKQIPMGLVTGRHAKDLEIVLRPHQLADYFVTLITDDQLTKSKPAPEGILIASKQMGLSPTNTFYVGDSTFDLKAAHAAGSVPIAAFWDMFVDAHEMKLENPRYIAQSPNEVWNYFIQQFPNYTSGA